MFWCVVLLVIKIKINFKMIVLKYNFGIFCMMVIIFCGNIYSIIVEIVVDKFIFIFIRL